MTDPSLPSTWLGGGRLTGWFDRVGARAAVALASNVALRQGEARLAQTQVRSDADAFVAAVEVGGLVVIVARGFVWLGLVRALAVFAANAIRLARLGLGALLGLAVLFARVGALTDTVLTRIINGGRVAVVACTSIRNETNGVKTKRFILDSRRVLVGTPSTKPQVHVFWLGPPAPIGDVMQNTSRIAHHDVGAILKTGSDVVCIAISCVVCGVWCTGMWCRPPWPGP